MALTSLSIGYAAWADQISLLDASVTTANMHAKWLSFPVLCGDNDGNPGIGQVDAARDAGDDQQMNFAISKAYPGYIAYCSFEFRNAGDVPVKIVSLDIDDIVIASGVPVDRDLTGDSVADVRITFSNGVGSTYAPGSGGSKALQVEVLPGAPPGTTMYFSGHVNMVMGGLP